MSRHYHVIENTPGYLPDDTEPPYAYALLSAARDAAQELADRYRDDPDGNYRVTGNKRDGYHVEDRDRTHDLGRVIDVYPCSDTECLEELEQ